MIAVSRQGIARSWLGVFAPIALVALAAMAADRIFHHAPPPVAQPRHATPPPARPVASVRAIVEPDAPGAPAQPTTTLDLLHKIRESCPQPERAGGCSPLTLTVALADDLPAIRAHYRTLEDRYLARLVSDDFVPIHALGFLHSRRALPVLRASLISISLTDWGVGIPSEPEIFYADKQFPRHLALMQAIESIEGLFIRCAFKLTRAEQGQLSRAAADCPFSTSAQWLLYKLDGTPLPTLAQIDAHRIACNARAHRL